MDKRDDGMSKPAGLAAFTRKTATDEQRKEATGGKKRGAGEVVAITVRVPKAEWVRLTNFAMEEGISLQTLAVRGFDDQLARKGLPPIRIDAKAS